MDRMNVLGEVIAGAVAYAGSPEEAIRMVDEDVKAGKCLDIPKSERDQRIRRLWQKRMEAKINCASR